MSIMKLFKNIVFMSLILVLLPVVSFAVEKTKPFQHKHPTFEDIDTVKDVVDDPRDTVQTAHPKDMLFPEVANKITFDIKEMKAKTEQILGFNAEDQVGKIAPEIKPGTYTYKDLPNNPGFKKLIPPELYGRIKEGGPPYAGNIMEFIVQPTKQFHLPTPVCDLTIKNSGKARLDAEGYMVKGSWQGGIPFPKPSGKMKAQQVFYDFFYRPTQWDYCFNSGSKTYGLNKNLSIDKDNAYLQTNIKYKGRCLFPPFGWLDEQAERMDEYRAFTIQYLIPRATRGTIILRILYDDPRTYDSALLYLPMVRRVRKMSATDTQDAIADLAYDDVNFLSQKISPDYYPYKYDIIDEREYLMLYGYDMATGWCDSTRGYGIKALPVMRRPTYVLQMTQLDPNYVYSKRIYYIDKETFQPCFAEFYDQKGRLYRTYTSPFVFISDCGQLTAFGQPTSQRDFIDRHSTITPMLYYPTVLERSHFKIREMIKRGR